MTYQQLFNTLDLMTLIVLAVTCFVQTRIIRSMQKTSDSVNRTWTRHAWAMYDVAAAAGIKLPQPPYERPERRPGARVS